MSILHTDTGISNIINTQKQMSQQTVYTAIKESGTLRAKPTVRNLFRFWRLVNGIIHSS